jgi:hypothetical protein
VRFPARFLPIPGADVTPWGTPNTVRMVNVHCGLPGLNRPCKGQLGKAGTTDDVTWSLNAPPRRFLHRLDGDVFEVRRKDRINVDAFDDDGLPIAPGPRGRLPQRVRGVIGDIPTLPAVVYCEFGHENEVALPPSAL